VSTAGVKRQLGVEKLMKILLPCPSLFVKLLCLYLLIQFYPIVASSHTRLEIDKSLPPRSTSDGLKIAPCGNVPPTSDPSTRAVLIAGQDLLVEWEETIDHPGHYRLAFSPADDLGFDENVLLDNLTDVQGGQLPHKYSATIQIPDVQCDTCSIQLIQYMTEATPPRLYFSCADIRIVSAVPNDTLSPEKPTNLVEK